MKTALITGIAGQDGSYLAELLLEKGYRVVGMVRRAEAGRLGNIEGVRDRVLLAEGDLTDQGSLIRVLREHRPAEVYNLAAMSHVAASWAEPVLAGEVTGLGVTRLLEAIRAVDRDIRFYQAGSSEMFGLPRTSPQNELTAFHPRSPYGAAKVYAHHITVNYRESYGLFACAGILFNHESPRRPAEFVTRKITSAAVRIKLGLDDRLVLGNTAARRDWGFAGDYVRAMWLMMQLDRPEDFVIGTGVQNSVDDFCRMAFDAVGLDHRRYVVSDPKLFRPAETDNVVADASKAKRLLGWEPAVDVRGLVEMMVRAEMARLGR
jgi:GDPmannose 4,6-dehydratase